MLNHEGANGILAALRAGDRNSAMGYVGGLIDTWTNRAAARGQSPSYMMDRPFQITDWNTDRGWIQQRANSLDPRIREIADAYLQHRAQGGAPVSPTASFYLNTELVRATPSYGTKYLKWYNPGTVVDAFGDVRNGGRSSVQTEFVENNSEYRVPQYTLALEQGLPLRTAPEGVGEVQGFTSSRPTYMRHLGSEPPPRPTQGFNPNSPTNPGVPDASGLTGGIGDPNFGGGISPEGFDRVNNPSRPISNPPEPPSRPDGVDYRPSFLDDFSDALTAGLEGAGNVVRDAAGNIISGIGGVFDNRQPIDPTGSFSGINTSGGVPSGSFGTGINAPPGVTVSDQSFAGTFDPSAYLAANADVRAAGINPFEHFLEYGAREGRAVDQSGRRFDPSAYASQNADVIAAGMDPLLHFTTYGAAEGRAAPLVGPGGVTSGVMNLGLTPTNGPANLTNFRAPDGTTFSLGPDSFANGLPPGFNETAYLVANPDVAAFVQATPGASAAQHYRDFGIREGRAIDPGGFVPTLPPNFTSTIPAGQAVNGLPPGFDAQAYLVANPDVAAARVDPAQHYRDFGIREGRALAPEGFAPTISAPPAVSGLPPGFDFDASAYLDANTDVRASGMDPLTHFTRYGLNEGRALNPQGLRLDAGFDGTAYLARNPDVAAAGLDPLRHFLDFGSAEGRQATLGETPYNWASFNTSAGASNGSLGTGINAAPPLQAAGAGSAGVGASAAGSGAAIPSPIAATGGGKGGVGASGVGGGSINMVSPYGFGTNVSAGVQPGSFGSPSAVGSAVNLGMGGQPAGAVSPYGFGANVGGFDVNSLGGAAPGPLAISRPGFTGYGGSTPGSGAIYGDGAAIQERNSQQSQANHFAIEANNRYIAGLQADAAAFNRSNIAPGAPIATVETYPFNPSGLGGITTAEIAVRPTVAPPAAPANNAMIANNIGQGAAAASNFFGGIRTGAAALGPNIFGRR
jgi:hypothetical protein